MDILQDNDEVMFVFRFFTGRYTRYNITVAIRVIADWSRGDSMRIRTGVPHLAFLIGVLIVLCALQSAHGFPMATPPGQTARWQYDLAPYTWFAGFTDDIGLGGQIVHIDHNFSQAIRRLDIAPGVRWSGWKKTQYFYIDGVYLHHTDDIAVNTPDFDQVHAEMKVFLLEGAYGYRFFGNDCQGFHALGGLRLWALDNTLDFQSALNPPLHLSGSKTWVDPFIGLDYYSLLDHQWSFTGQGDIGGFGVGSKWSWQIYAGVKYAFTYNFSLGLAYRAIKVNYDKNDFLYDVTTQGPLITFDFTY